MLVWVYLFFNFYARLLSQTLLSVSRFYQGLVSFREMTANIVAPKGTALQKCFFFYTSYKKILSKVSNRLKVANRPTNDINGYGKKSSCSFQTETTFNHLCHFTVVVKPSGFKKSYMLGIKISKVRLLTWLSSPPTFLLWPPKTHAISLCISDIFFFFSHLV